MGKPTVPGDHLLRAGLALRLIVSAVNGWLRGGDLLCGRRAGDVASEVLHVHVGLTTFEANISLGQKVTGERLVLKLTSIGDP